MLNPKRKKNLNLSIILGDIKIKCIPFKASKCPILGMVFGDGTTRLQRGIEFIDGTYIVNIELLEAHYDNQ